MSNSDKELSGGRDGRWTRHLASLSLLVILLLAAAVRAYGSNFGLPYVYHLDEPAIMNHSLLIERTKDLNPHWFDYSPPVAYPTLYIYLQVLVISITRLAVRAWAAWRGVAFDDLTVQGFIYQGGRLATVLFGTATVPVVYATGRRLFNREVGLWAALALAGTALHIRNSHYITPDIPCTFFAACCLYFAARALDTRSLADLTVSALMAGLAAGTKYNAGLVLVVTGLAFLLTRRGWRELLDPALVTIPLAAAAAFLGSTPYAVLDYPTFRWTLDFHLQHYQTGHDGFEGSDSWLWFARYLYTEGMFPILTWVSGLGVLYAALVRRTRKDLLLLVFPVFYYALISAQRVRFARNVIPILPFLALFAGRLIAELLDWLAARIKRSRLGKRLTAVMQAFGVLGVAILLVGAPLRQQLVVDYWLSQEDTRTIAKRWVEENIPAGAKIAVESYCPTLELSWKPGTKQPRYQVKFFNKLADHTLAFYQEQGYDYVVVSSSMYNRYFVDSVTYPTQRQFYESLFAQWPLVVEFTGYPVPMHDPVIRIYRVPGARQ